MTTSASICGEREAQLLFACGPPEISRGIPCRFRKQSVCWAMHQMCRASGGIWPL